MKRTVPVNLSGIAFIMDDDAYSLLQSYLNDISSRLTKVEFDNTMQDIEQRIAEVFKGKGLGEVRVVNIVDVRYIIAIIGSPNNFGNVIGAPQKPYYQQEYYPLRRKLLRDKRHCVFGGVCSGMAAYFGADITIIRVVMFLLVFLAGLSLWVYIILWIVTPAAITPQDIELVERMRNNTL